MTHSSTLELNPTQALLETKKPNKYTSKIKLHSFLTLGAISILVLSIGTISYLQQNQLLGTTLKSTIDNLSYHNTSKTLFSDIESYRENILNTAIKENPLSFHRKNDNKKVQETPRGKEHREKIINQLKNQGVFIDKLKFEGIYQPLLIAIKNQNDFNNKKIDFIQMTQANKNIKDIRETFLFENNKTSSFTKK